MSQVHGAGAWQSKLPPLQLASRLGSQAGQGLQLQAQCWEQFGQRDLEEVRLILLILRGSMLAIKNHFTNLV